MYKAIIVEDERRIRETLILKIKENIPRLEVVDGCATAQSALESVLKHSPDLLLLDISLRGGEDGFWLIEQLEKVRALPFVIFITSHSDTRYLQEAIRLSAVDYLIKEEDVLTKPVAVSSLMLAFERFVKRMEIKSDKPVTSKKILLDCYNKLRNFNIEDICYFRSNGHYAFMTICDGSVIEVAENLSSLEKKLRNCIRLGRFYLVNPDSVDHLNMAKCVCVFNGGQSVDLKHEQLIILKKTLDRR